MENEIRFDTPIIMNAAYKLPEDQQRENRFGYESFAHSYEVNNQHYQFTAEGLLALAAGYNDGKILSLNHNKEGFGWGQTIAGEVRGDGANEADGAYVQWYILKGKTFPTGMLGSSDEVIESIDDGCIKKVSVGCKILKSSCSVCGSEFSGRWFRYCKGPEAHEPGHDYVVDKDGTKSVQTCIQMIEDCEAIELSLVYDGADSNARIVNRAAALHRDGLMDDTAYAEFSRSYPENQSGGGVPPQPNNRGDEMPTVEQLQAEAKNLNARIDTLDAEKRAAEAEKQLESDKVARLNTQIDELNADNKKFETYKAEAELAREKALEDFSVQYVAHKEGVTDKDRDEKKDAAANLSLTEIYEQADSYRVLAEARLEAGRSSVSEGEGGKPEAEKKETARRRGSVRY